MYIVKSLCDINGYVFTIKKKKKECGEMRGGEGVVTTAFVLRRDDRGHDEKRLAIIIWTRYG